MKQTGAIQAERKESSVWIYVGKQQKESQRKKKEKKKRRRSKNLKGEERIEEHRAWEKGFKE